MINATDRILKVKLGTVLNTSDRLADSGYPGQGIETFLGFR